MPASITIALVASSPNVTGSRMLMPDSGPIPGSTPTSVPTRQPRKPYSRTSGRKATEKPSARLSRVASTGAASVPEGAGRQRRLEQLVEQQPDEARNTGAEGGRVEDRAALDHKSQ